MRGNNLARFEAEVRRVRSTADGHLRTELSIDFRLGEMNSVGCYAQILIEARAMPDLMGNDLVVVWWHEHRPVREIHRSLADE